MGPGSGGSAAGNSEAGGLGSQSQGTEYTLQGEHATFQRALQGSHPSLQHVRPIQSKLPNPANLRLSTERELTGILGRGHALSPDRMAPT